MKVRTVAALAALSMTFTSFAVWSLTDPARSARDGVPERPRGNERPLDPARDGAADFRLTGTLEVDGRLGHERLASDRESETYVLVTVRAGDASGAVRAERHLVIVVDRSGSMQGKRLSNAVAAAQGAVGRLRDGDLVSVVDYATTARQLVPPTRLDERARTRILREIGELSASGDTCISCALETSFGVLRSRSGAVERVLLLSDGEATTGVLDVESMRRVAARFREAGATVTTIGVDVDYNERLLAAIAQEANGRHHFVASPTDLGPVFDDERDGLERTVARGTRLELELAPGVELLEVAERAVEREGSRAVVSLGTFSAGEVRTVLARVRVPRAAPGERNVVHARIAYEDLETGSPARDEARLAVRLTSDGSESPLDALVEERVKRSGTVTALDEASRLFESGDAPAARTRVESVLSDVKKQRTAAVAAARPADRRDLDDRFARQEAALGSALDGFAAPPPPAAAAPEQLRESKAVLKQNQVEALELTR